MQRTNPSRPMTIQAGCASRGTRRSRRRWRRRRRFRSADGGCSIAGITGTSRVWPMAGTAGWIRMWGSPNGIQAWQICKGPRHFTGNLVSQFAHSWVATVDRPRVYTAWGGSTEISNYDDSCRTSVEASNQADVRIIVDPRVTNLGKESDYHLALRPGTDAAMAMGWAYIVVDHQLYDDLYVKKLDQRAVSGRRGHGAVRLRHGFDQRRPLHAEDAPAQSERFGRERQSPPLHGMGRPRGSTHLFR